ncbi:hypothetical protein IFM89_001137 [Coptis chinensis]|uniref:Protein Abitram n=1 Tax=Coptis chinensis TaxID=261450 RepID=A0A835M969_9MAGN|nr:hypothetical protein IFM89_001137 [Coptis chinensis]
MDDGHTNTETASPHQQQDEELHSLLVPNIDDLPVTPPSATDSNFVTYFAPDFINPGHDQYVHRHANGLCVIGLAPTHIALRENEPVKSVDFNVGKSNRSEIKVTGKHKRNARHFERNTALCKVFVKETSYIVRCCVKGSLLEVNDRLIKQPDLLNSAVRESLYHHHHHLQPPYVTFLPNHSILVQVYGILCILVWCMWHNLWKEGNSHTPSWLIADREGYIAITMPKPGDWLKIRNLLLTLEEYKKLRDLC